MGQKLNTRVLQALVLFLTLPGFHFGYRFLTHSQIDRRESGLSFARSRRSFKAIVFCCREISSGGWKSVRTSRQNKATPQKRKTHKVNRLIPLREENNKKTQKHHQQKQTTHHLFGHVGKTIRLHRVPSSLSFCSFSRCCSAMATSSRDASRRKKIRLAPFSEHPNPTKWVVNSPTNQNGIPWF